MDFTSAVQALDDGKATKVPSFSGGYVKRVDTTPATGQVETFKLVFVKYTSGGATPTTYQFTVSRDSNKKYTVNVPSPNMPLDGQLMAAMLFSNDWYVGTAESFEARRTGDAQDW